MCAGVPCPLLGVVQPTSNLTDISGDTAAKVGVVAHNSDAIVGIGSARSTVGVAIITDIAHRVVGNFLRCLHCMRGVTVQI